MSALNKSKLIIRNAEHGDIPALVELGRKVYNGVGMTSDMVRGQINNYPEGQFVAVYDGNIVGHCATFIISEEIALHPHDWSGITGGGFASRHNSNGDYLYGMEVCVNKDFRGLRIGQRLYDARKRLCQELGLKGIVFGGRIPGYAKRAKKIGTPQLYIDEIVARRMRDQVVNFQLNNGFKILGILPDYLPIDKESEGFATLMLWENPQRPESIERSNTQRGRLFGSVRLATVQFQARKVESYEHFESQVEYFVEIASSYKADFVTFPEWFTLPLLALQEQKLNPAEAMHKMAEYTDRYRDFMQQLAITYNINIIGGTQPTLTKDKHLNNTCFVFLRDGAVHTQSKLHATPNERRYWDLRGSNDLDVISTDCGPIGVLICYDSEFPEAARHLANQGALMLFVPFCTDERQGYLRVRYCSAARAVENQMYVITSGMVGNLPNVENMDIHYAESSILTPCDFPFARDGIAATTAQNTEMIAFADVNLQSLMAARQTGTVQNMLDRRFDLYNVKWKVDEL